jgi:predicted dehydrogenase
MSTAETPSAVPTMTPGAGLRIAIIGTGMIGGVHARGARAAGAEIAGVLGSSPSRSASAAREWGARSYRSIEELLADSPDVVHICTPNATHSPYAHAAIAAGRNVICEKPLGIDAVEARALARAARRAGVVATVPFVYRYHPLVREIRRRRQRGELGDIILAHGSYLQDWLFDARASSWRVDPQAGGASRAFADIGSHWCDLVEFVSGERLTSASAVMTIAHARRPTSTGPSFGAVSDGATQPVRTEDAASVLFRTAQGATASVVVSQVSAGRKNRLWFELDGTRGSAVFDQENPETAWFGDADGVRIVRRGEGSTSPEQRRLNVFPAGHVQGWGDAFAAFIADTYSAVRGETPEGLPTFDDGVRAAQVVDAVVRSAASEGWSDIG